MILWSLVLVRSSASVGRVGSGRLAGGPLVLVCGASARAGGRRPELGPLFERRGSKFKAAMEADGAEARDGSSGNGHLEICTCVWLCCPESATALVPASCEAEHAVSTVAEAAFFPSFWF